MASKEMRTPPVYLYIDEAGNFDFSPKGSQYFILTAVVMSRPFAHINALAAVKYDCIESGLDEKKHPKCHEFHAATDAQSVRDRVFDVICRDCANVRIYSVIIRKNKTDPALRLPDKLYTKAFEWLVKRIAACEAIGEGTLVVAITDSYLFKGKTEAVKAAIKSFLDKCFARAGIEYRYYQHLSESDVNLQIADYCCWAIQRKWERGDTRSYDIICEMVKNEGDVLKRESAVYYEFR